MCVVQIALRVSVGEAHCCSENVPDLTIICRDFPLPTIKFHDFSGLENEILKFHDFPGFQ